MDKKIYISGVIEKKQTKVELYDKELNLILIRKVSFQLLRAYVTI